MQGFHPLTFLLCLKSHHELYLRLPLPGSSLSPALTIYLPGEWDLTQKMDSMAKNWGIQAAATEEQVREARGRAGRKATNQASLSLQAGISLAVTRGSSGDLAHSGSTIASAAWRSHAPSSKIRVPLLISLDETGLCNKWRSDICWSSSFISSTHWC